jgi:diguanylate cyclase (GGDEF)-like protein
MHRTPEGLLARLAPQLTRLEKRDWELWAIVSVTGILVSLGLAALILPAAFLKDDNIHFEITVSRPLAIGLIVLLALLNTYLFARRLEIRRLREELISTTLQQQLTEQQSFTDPLTEIYSRRSLDDIAGRFISRAKRLGNPLTFLMVDVDHFKQVNTKFGHLTGDTVLAEFASLLKASIRGSDAVVRYGGDEFLIVLVDSTAIESEKVVDRINQHLTEWNTGSPLDGFQLSASIGIAEWHDGETLDEVLDVADRNMYRHKTRPRALLSRHPAALEHD